VLLFPDTVKNHQVADVQAHTQPEGFVARYRFSLLFVVLLLFYVLVPVVHRLREALHPMVPPVLEQVVFVAVLAAVVVSVSSSRSWKFFTFGFGLPAAALGLLQVVLASGPVRVLHHLFGLAFLGYGIGVMLRGIFTHRRVTPDTLFASLCVYLLLGVVWSLAYSVIDLLDPAAFRWTLQTGQFTTGLPVATEGRSAALYFSFATLTTLGSNLIAPVSPVSCMLTTLEAVTGQFYLAVLVARPVGLQITESSSRPKAPQQEGAIGGSLDRRPRRGGDDNASCEGEKP
jgi:hypothetical protein